MGLKVFDNGKEFENEVKTLLEKKGLEVKEQPLLTPFNLRFDFLVSNNSGSLFAIEVTKRNSTEDIQKLCFRSIACKGFHEKIKTVAVVPAPNGNLSKLKTIAMLSRFYDMFLFEEYLELLPNLFGESSKIAFFEFIKNALASVNPDFGKILEVLQEHTLIEMKDLSRFCNLPRSRVKQLIKKNAFGLSTLGLVEGVGHTYMLTNKLKIKKR